VGSSCEHGNEHLHYIKGWGIYCVAKQLLFAQERLHVKLKLSLCLIS
jgi:hypothetical protein